MELFMEHCRTQHLHGHPEREGPDMSLKVPDSTAQEGQMVASNRGEEEKNDVNEISVK